MTNARKTLRQILTKAELPTDLLMLLEDIATACRAVAGHVRNGALMGVQGAAESTNVQGEEQKKLDVIADEEFMAHCATSSKVAALVSEEVEEVHWLKDNPEPDDFVVFFDPLDGSSNVDVNLSVGSIFSIMRLDSADRSDAAVLRAGVNQVAAGYAIYGPSTGLVLTTGDGVNGFTLDEVNGTFCLTHPQMTVPKTTVEYAINASRENFWFPPIKNYISDCVAGKDGPRGEKFNMRWTASMVADVHRILNRGGVFLYPMDSGNEKTGGKLRLMYEANPMGMLIEQAGGAASTGLGRIMEVDPQTHHQRVPVILGSRDEVQVIEDYHKRNDGS